LSLLKDTPTKTRSAFIQYSLVAILAPGLAVALSACGVGSALDATKSVPDQINQTNAQVKATNDQVKATNDKMDKTNRALHLKTLDDAMARMRSPDNTRFLVPPTGIMLEAKPFAEEVAAEEIVELAYDFIKDIDEVQPDEAMKQADPARPGAESRWPAALVAEVDHDKLAKFWILTSISGFLPQATVEQMARRQIVEGGMYEETAYAVLALRSFFISQILVEGDVFAQKLTNLGKIEKAYNRVSRLDWIARQPFIAHISYKMHGMLDKADNLAVEVDSGATKEMWGRLAKAVDKELDPAKLASAPNAQARLQALRDLIHAGQNPAAAGAAPPSPPQIRIVDTDDPT
jgi:hypothetical protein